MNQIKPLNAPQLKNWFNEKFRDEFLVKSPYDKKAHQQILDLIENNGNGGLETSSPSITERLDEIQAVIEKNHKYKLLDKDALREELKIFMAEKDLTIKDVAGLIKRDSCTVWKFLHKKVKSQDGTVYKIKELVRRNE